MKVGKTDMTLKEAFASAVHKYYDDCPDMDFSNFGHEIAYNYIRGTYEVGKKDKIFDVGFHENFEENGKHEHTATLYFLGCLLKDFFTEELEKYLSSYMQTEGWWTFLYTWYLTSLYHDTASVIEKEEWAKGCSQDLDFYLGKYDIKYNVYQHKWSNQSRAPYTYPENLIKNYFRYRVDYYKSIDHGIIAGYLIYDRLIKNYNEKWEECKKENVNAEYKGFSFKDLCWRMEHQSHFAIIADAIIAHNIWLSGEDDKKVYKEYGLKPLIIGPNKKISIKKNPLLFFLGLLDTLEPIKNFPQEKPLHVLNSIEFYLDERTKQISFIIDSSLAIDRWNESISNAEKWLDVSIKRKCLMPGRMFKAEKL